MLNALNELGIECNLTDYDLIVKGNGINGFTEPKVPLFCGNSATTMRLLSGAIAASGIEATLDGSEGLRQRPMKRIVEPLQMMGVKIIDTNGNAPIHIYRSKLPLKCFDYRMPVASAQLKSCLLLAALATEGESFLYEPASSRDHTERMLTDLGLYIVSNNIDLLDKNSKEKSDLSVRNSEWVQIRIINHYPPKLKSFDLRIPGDISSASFVIVAALIVPNSEIVIKGIGINPTRIGLVNALKMMGAEIEIKNISILHGEPVGDIYVKHSELVGVNISGSLVVRMIDEFPIFAIAAACANGTTIVSDAIELRHKESDRIADLVEQLKKIGVQISEKPDGFEIEGGHPLHGSIIDPYGDHRLAMALAVAGLITNEEMVIRQADVIDESFPNFVEVLNFLGGSLYTKELIEKN